MIRFPRVFAPQEGTVSSVERQFRDERCLNGTWRFQAATSQLPEPAENEWEKTPIRIPSPWNVNAFPVESRNGGDFRAFPSYPPSWEKAQAGWLKRTFRVPASWKGRHLILRFEAIAGDAQVFVNGKPVARHFDLFLPFETDVTDAVRWDSENELLVGVRKASLTDVPGPTGRRTYQGGSMWGQAIAGIWQDVFLKAVPEVRIDDVFVEPDVAHDTLGAEVTLRNDGSSPRRVRLTGDVREWLNKAGTTVLDAPEPKSSLGRTVLSQAAATVIVPAHGIARVSLSSKVSGKLRTWAPCHPNLYSLICRMDGDTKETRFGWRQVSFSGTKVLLNGKPLVMRGDSWHFMGVPQMTRRYAWAWFKTLQDAGLNAVRLHAQPYPSFYLDMADEMGVLVLDETAIWASDGGPKLDSDAFWTDSKRHLRDLVRRDRNHPSVFGWSVSNEVMAVVRNVFHAPKAIEEKASSMNGDWADICRAEDPTRVWISADGEEDGQGRLPVSMIHYGDRSTMQEAIRRGKPWGVGEAGPAYYGSPKQIAEMAKDSRAYVSFADRMEGVAKVSYQSLKDQNDLGGSYRSVFNLVWYGLKPLELGLDDTSRPPMLSDGVRFPKFVEGRPGMQPERLGPYCTTLNPGYDPRLPLYSPWPLFQAIKNAAHELPWSPSGSAPEIGEARSDGKAEARVLGGEGSDLARSLIAAGARVSSEGELLFVDGANPPSSLVKPTIDSALGQGRTVVVWGARTETLEALNALLPHPLELTSRTASSLIAEADRLTAGLGPAALYFSEEDPSTILKGGLGGPLLKGARVLLQAPNVDWRKWNGQAETVKTSMVLRSEREAKDPGVAMAVIQVGPGRLVLIGLPTFPATAKAEALNRALLGNLGLAVGPANRSQNALDEEGNVTRVLSLGPLAATASDDSLPSFGREISVGNEFEGSRWSEAGFAGKEGLPVSKGRTYLSFWIYCPISLDELLLDPHLPKVSLRIDNADLTKIWLDDKLTAMEGPLAALSLRQGWNHLLIRLDRRMDEGRVRLRLTSTQPEFLRRLRGVAGSPAR